MTKMIAPVFPGEMLKEIGDIISGKRGITADTGLRLCRFFGHSDGWAWDIRRESRE